MRDEEGKEIWEGYCIDFIKKLSEEMQFDYDLVIPDNQEFGKRLPNGEWNGLIGDLVKGVGFSGLFSYLCTYVLGTDQVRLLTLIYIYIYIYICIYRRLISLWQH